MANTAKQEDKTQQEDKSAGSANVDVSCPLPWDPEEGEPGRMYGLDMVAETIDNEVVMVARGVNKPIVQSLLDVKKLKLL